MTTKPFSSTRPTCDECGHKYDSIALWDDLPRVCGTCADVRWTAHLAFINAGRNYTAREIGGACPTQATGRTWDGRPFYFRARHGEWSLEFGSYSDPDDYLKWRVTEIEAEGDDPTMGGMPEESVLAILDNHCGGEA